MRIERLTDIPDSEVEEVVGDFRSEGATVEKTKERNGTWTVTATFPDLGVTAPRPSSPEAAPLSAGGGDASDALRGHLVYGAKVSPVFREKVRAIGREIGVNANYLMAVMAFETGGTFSPSIVNAAGSGATGLIQFMASTARSLGTSVEELKDMTAEEQLDYVRKYFQPYKGKLETMEDTYMAVLWPKAIGRPNDFVLWEQGSIAYTQNAGLDINHDGKVTKAEAASKVMAALERGKTLAG